MNTQAIALFPRLRLAFAALALLGLAAACSSPEVSPVNSEPSALSAEDYEASCAADGDCVTATFGEVCSLGCNPNGAIRSSEQARYLADLKERDRPTARG